MKTVCSLILFFVVGSSFGQHKLEKLWETDSTLAVPESVLFTKDGLYAALINGAPWEADGIGEIAKIDKSGKIVNATWATGLNAPKGMAMWEDKLYVADLTAVAVINKDGKVETRIEAPGAVGLNDVAASTKGIIYVTDSKAGTVYRITKGKAELYLTELKGINGIKAVGSDLYLLTAAGVMKADKDKKVTLLAAMEIGGDGIEPVGNGDYIVSCWPGLVYYLTKDGKMETLLDTREQKIMSADIGYDPSTKIVYVPTFFRKSVVAYQLK